MKLIVNAANVHQGGGRTLLLALLYAIRQPATVLLDDRLALPQPLPDFVEVIRIRPTLAGRFFGERRLSQICGPDDILLCFGNLPPMFRNLARTFVFLQNRYLTSKRSLSGLRLSTRLRLLVERLWLRTCLRAATVIVQTSSMSDEVLAAFGKRAILMPFVGALAAPSINKGDPRQDYVYVASGEAHKNHVRLIEAWRLLANDGHFPSLRLTLNAARDGELLKWVLEQTATLNLRVSNGEVGHEDVADLYASSGALIYPSLFESFGLPLIEAQNAGLPVLAPERDYVRDVIEPVQTFDPESPRSISRAVLRHMQIGVRAPKFMSPAEFLHGLSANR